VLKRRISRMFWESSIPNVLAGDASLQASSASAPPMDDEAFAAFYERSARSLWAYLARTSGDPTLAEDIMQESYVRFLCLENPPSYLAEGEIACRRYLFRIATNLLRDHWRRPHAASIEDMPEGLFAQADDQAPSDSQMILGPALASMRLRDRQLLWLAHAEGYSHREIAEITGLAAASIRLMLFRARRKIARLLQNRERGIQECGREA